MALAFAVIASVGEGLIAFALFVKVLIISSGVPKFAPAPDGC
jgi:hypothetical protein